MAPNDLVVPYSTLLPFVGSIFRSAGCSEAESERISRYLISANLTGHDSHGIIRVPRYVSSLKMGMVQKDQQLTVISEGPSHAMVSGNYGFGQTVAPLAVEMGIKKAKETGMAIVGLREAGHVGRVGDWGEMAAEQGLVSIHFVNVGKAELVAPFGGTSKRFSTNPFCVCVPQPDGRPPLLLDYATSTVAEGKILVASNGGKPVPATSMITKDGQYSGDPEVLYGPLTPGGPRNPMNGTGSMTAFGEHKGSALAFMCDVLAGCFIGSPTSGPVPPPSTFDKAAPYRSSYCNGMLSIYVDPARIGAPAEFAAKAADFAEYVRASEPAAPSVNPSQRVLCPGDAEAETRAKRMKEGVPVPKEVWDGLVSAAKEVGAEVPSL
ncbi:Malate/L-lactate dehydrogenase [Hyaloraphidium curvatum]|nr:Malate/L-lactate dehydrogenase [Hyaloraphidium curvatum]